MEASESPFNLGSRKRLLATALVLGLANDCADLRGRLISGWGSTTNRTRTINHFPRVGCRCDAGPAGNDLWASTTRIAPFDDRARPSLIGPPRREARFHGHTHCAPGHYLRERRVPAGGT